MNLRFYKYHAYGNDYLLIDQKDLKNINLTKKKIKNICNRNTGIGSDGLLILDKKKNNFFELKIYNSDGTRAYKSGNGMRISACHFYLKYKNKNKFFIQIKNKKFSVNFVKQKKNEYYFLIEMGEYLICDKEINYQGEKLIGKYIDVGNPHFVILNRPKINKNDFIQMASNLQNHKDFEKTRGINIQVLLKDSNQKNKIFIFERGSGYTLASGSSSCAVATTLYQRDNFSKKSYKIHNELGIQKILFTKNSHIFLESCCSPIFQGSFNLNSI